MERNKMLLVIASFLLMQILIELVSGILYASLFASFGFVVLVATSIIKNENGIMNLAWEPAGGNIQFKEIALILIIIIAVVIPLSFIFFFSFLEAYLPTLSNFILPLISLALIFLYLRLKKEIRKPLKR